METNIILISILVIINILTEVLLGIEPRLKASKALFLTIRTQDHITNKWGTTGNRTQDLSHPKRESYLQTIVPKRTLLSELYASQSKVRNKLFTQCIFVYQHQCYIRPEQNTNDSTKFPFGKQSYANIYFFLGYDDIHFIAYKNTPQMARKTY